MLHDATGKVVHVSVSNSICQKSNAKTNALQLRRKDDSVAIGVILTVQVAGINAAEDVENFWKSVKPSGFGRHRWALRFYSTSGSDPAL